jgi:hypothetical protein
MARQRLDASASGDVPQFDRCVEGRRGKLHGRTGGTPWVADGCGTERLHTDGFGGMRDEYMRNGVQKR